MPACIRFNMCRLLVVRSEKSFDITPHLEQFAHISKHSREYQGHGWGCAYKNQEGDWALYRNINPVWEDDLSQFPSTRILVAHARSAFEDRDIFIENNMPFFDGKTVFIFNGELRGVKIRAEGRIGAEKIFNYIRRFDKGDTLEAMRKAVGIIEKRSKYIRAMNILMADDKRIYLSTLFNEDEAYFTMHYKEGAQLVICSDPYPSESGWRPISNHTMRVW